MRGNLTVLGILGLFLIGAIWITLWAPEIPGKTDHSASVSWYDYPVPDSPIADLGPRELQRLKAVRKQLKRKLAGAKSKKRKKKNKKRKRRPLSKADRKIAQIDAKLKLAKQQIAAGGELFKTYCAQCHGDKGKGDGFAASFLEVPPRNFYQANYRFKTAAQGRLPHDADLFRTISLGSRRTPMPGFAKILTPEQRWNLIQYLKTLSRKWGKAKSYDHGPPIETVLGPPPRDLLSARMKSLGRKSYQANCSKCHGEQGYGDGASADGLRDDSAGDDKKTPLAPRNFHQPWMFKRGHALKDIAITITLGLESVGMPSHAPPTLTREAIWATAQYVLSMSDKVPTPKLPRSKPVRLSGRIQTTLQIRSRAWKYQQLVDVVKKGRETKEWVFFLDKPIQVVQGQLVELIFKSADNGTGRGQGLAIAGYEASVYLTGVTTDRPARVVFRANKAGTFRIYNPMQTAPGDVLAKMTGILKVTPRKK